MNWFGSKTRNRRLNRGNVLDVRLRSDQVRAGRVRLASRLMTVVFAVLLTGFLSWRGGAWLMNQLVFQNPALAIEVIDARSDGSLSPDLIRRWSGVRVGENLLALDLARVRRNLLLNPLVEDAAVDRVFPNLLRIRLAEREPLVRVSIPRIGPSGVVERQILLLDAAGHVMVPVETGRPGEIAGLSPSALETLPLLTGISESELRVGRDVESSKIHAALDLVQAFERSEMVGLADLVYIDLGEPEVLTVRTGQRGRITFGLQNLPEQLRRWRLIYNHGRELGRSVANADLSIASRVPVQWLEAGMVLPTPKKPARTPRNRRSHV